MARAFWILRYHRWMGSLDYEEREVSGMERIVAVSVEMNAANDDVKGFVNWKRQCLEQKIEAEYNTILVVVRSAFLRFGMS